MTMEAKKVKIDPRKRKEYSKRAWKTRLEFFFIKTKDFKRI